MNIELINIFNFTWIFVGIRYIVVNKVTMFSLRYMMNDYMVHMVHRITTSRTDTAPARLTSSSSSARRPTSRRCRQHTGHRADTYIYVICIHMHFVHVFLCIRRSTAALVHPCVQTYIRRSGAPPLLSHRPFSWPSWSTFILSLSLMLNNHTRANRAVDVLYIGFVFWS